MVYMKPIWNVTHCSDLLFKEMSH